MISAYGRRLFCYHGKRKILFYYGLIINDNVAKYLLLHVCLLGTPFTYFSSGRLSHEGARGF